MGRVALGLGSAGLVQSGLVQSGLVRSEVTAAAAEPEVEPETGLLGPTQFQIACMTLPYQQFPLDRALQGIKKSGFDSVAWGTTHRETAGGPKVPVMAADAPPAKALALAVRCRDLGLEPVMMFSEIYPEAENAVEVLTARIRQAAAANIGQILTFGHTEGGSKELWIKRFKMLGPIASDHGVTIVIKQHGGSTGTGKACAEIVHEISHPNIHVNYDAGNVMGYLNVDPISDIQHCADKVRSFCIKDHRSWPQDEDCGPGFGQIDHYRLLHPVAFSGRKMPLCCENIFEPLVARPSKPEGVDALARRARVYLETVIAGLQRLGNEGRGNG